MRGLCVMRCQANAVAAMMASGNFILLFCVIRSCLPEGHFDTIRNRYQRDAMHRQNVGKAFFQALGHHLSEDLPLSDRGVPFQKEG